MSLQTITGKRVGDTISRTLVRQLFLFVKKNESTYAVFGTKYGSNDNQFHRSDEDTVHTVPEVLRTFRA
ncbi:MAG: hypothetical protein ACLSCV_08690 [Acutalibacteraceae bacterium]